jgi:hypothetical protein
MECSLGLLLHFHSPASRRSRHFTPRGREQKEGGKRLRFVAGAEARQVENAFRAEWNYCIIVNGTIILFPLKPKILWLKESEPDWNMVETSRHLQRKKTGMEKYTLRAAAPARALRGMKHEAIAG